MTIQIGGEMDNANDNEKEILDAIIVENEDEDRNTTQLEHGETIQIANGNEPESEEEFWQNFHTNRRLKNEMFGANDFW